MITSRDIANAHIHAGFHDRDSTIGRETGRPIGNGIVQTAMQPLP